MSLEGVDYSYDRPDPAKLVAAGKHFACRYLSDEPVKNLTRAEADAGAKAGLWWVVVWEAGHGQTTPPATWCAAESVKQAKAVGVPAGRPIYFAVDFDAQSSQFNAIEDFLLEYAAHLSPYVAGIYGGEAVVTEMLDRGVTDWAWQTYAWSDTRDPRAKLWQYSNNVELVGANVDLDRAYADDYGQWRPNQLPEGEDDDVDDATINKIADAVIAKFEKRKIRSNFVAKDSSGKPTVEDPNDSNIFDTVASSNTNTTRIYLGKSQA
jgi:hypothetical protein